MWKKEEATNRAILKPSLLCFYCLMMMMSESHKILFFFCVFAFYNGEEDPHKPKVELEEEKKIGKK
jgi:cytochrome c oxidase subunit IV